jgi:hypothetical protein
VSLFGAKVKIRKNVDKINTQKILKYKQLGGKRKENCMKVHIKIKELK